MIALVALAVTAFPGGSTNALVNLIRETNKQDTFVVRAKPKDDLAKLEFDSASIESINTALRTKLNLKIIPGTEPLFSDDRASSALFGFYGISGGVSGASPIPLTTEAFKDGKLTFRTESTQVLDLRSLAGAPFAKPVTVNWTLIGLLPSVDVRDSTQVAFLDKLARAVGAKFRETDKAYEFEFRAEEFRRRALNSLEEIKFDDGSMPADELTPKLELAKSALRSISGNELTEAFRTPTSQVEISLANEPGLKSACKTYLQAVQRHMAKLVNAGALNSSGDVNTALKNEDRKRPPKLIFTAKFDVQVEIPIVDEKGDPAGVVRF
jgi:hypothetical protein